MKLIAIILAVISAAACADERIISGEPAALGQFPWHVATHFRNTFCGGALISDQWVLTAAHCAQGVTNYTVKLGGVHLFQEEEGRVSVPSSRIFIHPDYNALVHNDAALIRLDHPVQLNDRVQPARLPSRGETLGVNATVTVSGWGRTSDASGAVSETLNFVNLRTIDNEECQSVYGNGIIIDSTLCCRGNPEHSVCNGDSGGPLVQIKDGVATHMGIISWVHIDGCGSGYPSGYVRTEAMLDWIEQIMLENA